MKDTLRKIGLFGLGVATLTAEKIQEVTEELVEQGEMNKEEGKKFVAEVLQEKDKKLKEIGDLISQKFRETVDKSGLATKDDIKCIKERLDTLDSKRLERIKKLKEELETLENP